MKLILLLLFLFVVPAAAHLKAQQITITVKDAPLEDVMTEIRKQTDYNFVYRPQVKEKAKKVTVNIAGKQLTEALDLIFRDQDITYTISGRSIILSVKEKPTTGIQQQPIKGKVTDEEGAPLMGATVRVKGTQVATTTDHDGNFTLPSAYENALLEISFLGFTTQEVPAGSNIMVKLLKSRSTLDEAVVIAYGSTTRRLNTGSVSRVTADEIAKQPSDNILGVLAGRVPGLVVNQSSGTPGSPFSVQIRGRNSITQGSDPLILIDGIPFAAGNENINTQISAIGNKNDGGGLSPFFSISPANIESIEVLKDADATAIYGSRGANGVILITTKKGQTGSTQATANFNQGFSRTQKSMPMMNTEQYLAMRNEAFKNSGVTPTATNAPDLTVWDQNRYTDIRKELTGNTAHITNAQLSISGGSANTQFLLGGTYYRETNVFPGNLPNNRGSMNFNLNHTSTDQRFKVLFSGSYTATVNNTTGTDLTYYISLPPNIPTFFNDQGNLNWTDGFENPYRYLFNTYKATTGNLMGSMNLTYRILHTLSFKALVGYNELQSNDKKLAPKTSRSPTDTQLSTADFGNRQYKNWNIEPQLEYNNNLWVGKINVLVGATLLEKNTTGSTIGLTGFPSDALLESAAAASTVTSKSSTDVQYRYQAFFGRINYNIEDKYLLNITARRDGSSRFAPEHQFANFGAIGAAWIFTGENWVKDHINFLSYGKLRGSYGVTGNDQIGDYQYLDSWNALSSADGIYQGSTALFPSNLYNPVYAWEKNKKLEAALELGFFHDRLLLNVDFFRNRSSNQLVQYSLPYTTGFGSILMNFPALVENKGWEITLSGDIIKTTHFKWNSNFNITIPKNTLLAFPDIKSSTYAALYVIGQPLNLLYNYRSLGVDAATGLFHFVDANSDNSISSPADYLVNGSLDPKFYGGFRNTVQYKGFALDMFLDYKKQLGRNYLRSLYRDGTKIPGTTTNQPAATLERWQNIGDITNIEKFTYVANPNRTNVSASNALYSDQSFIRLRSVQLSYTLSPQFLTTLRAKSANLYIQGQNLYTWNKDKGYDPEVQSLYALAPLRTYTIGIQLIY